MGRAKRADEAGAIYPMLNRANRRATIFHKDAEMKPSSESSPKRSSACLSYAEVVAPKCSVKLVNRSN